MAHDPPLTAKILIVDDDSAVRDSVRTVLEAQSLVSFDFREAIDVPSALEAIHSNQPDLIILDLHMKGKSGFALTKHILNGTDHAGIKVLMLTADNTHKNYFKLKDRSQQRYEFMGKPFDISELQASVYNLLFYGSTAPQSPTSK